MWNNQEKGLTQIMAEESGVEMDGFTATISDLRIRDAMWAVIMSGGNIIIKDHDEATGEERERPLFTEERLAEIRANLAAYLLLNGIDPPKLMMGTIVEMPKNRIVVSLTSDNK